jgi:hypothetical protein
VNRSYITALLLQGIALALLVLMIAVAPGAAAACALLSGSPPLQRLLADYPRPATGLAAATRIDRSRLDR